MEKRRKLMKVCKIGITKTFMDVSPEILEDGYLNEFHYHGQSYYLNQLEDKKWVNPSEIQKVIYGIREIINGGERKYYALKLDDNEIFTELLECSRAMLEEKLNNAREIARDEGYDEGVDCGFLAGRETERKQIQKLPWWKRLFNKF
jgi:hypothetical protein